MNKIVWTEAKVFEIGTANGLVLLIVSKSSHYPFPRYSCKIGTELRLVKDGEDTRFLPFFNPRIDGQKMCQPVIDGTLSGLIGLLNEAEEWIHQDAHRIADEVQTDRERRDRTAADRDRPETRVTGKTERKRQAKKAA